MIDSEFIEYLLHEDEGVELDFKQEQYLFEDMNALAKSELLKDILSFVNAWRRSTAYILIGVEEVRGGRSNIVGVSTHLADADLQQFVNSKTQRPVSFSYQCCSVSGVEMGIIEIPVQERPIYATKTYGKVKKEAVYLRRGSSTAVARPDEVAKMGMPREVLRSTTSPKLTLGWSDDSRETLGSICALRSLVLEPRLPDDTFLDWESALSLALNPTSKDPDYVKEVIDYVCEHSFFKPLRLRIHNDSEITARRIRFAGSIGKSDGVEVREYLADMPKQYWDLSSPMPRTVGLLRAGQVDRTPDLRERCDKWELSIEFGDIRPQETLWSDGDIFLGSTNGTGAVLEGELLGDNIRHPVSCVLEIAFEVERRAMILEDVWPYLTAGTV